MRVEAEDPAKQRMRAKKGLLVGDATLGVCVVLPYCGLCDRGRYSVTGRYAAYARENRAVSSLRLHADACVEPHICYNALDQPHLHQKGPDTATHCQFTDLFSRIDEMPCILVNSCIKSNLYGMQSDHQIVAVVMQ